MDDRNLGNCGEAAAAEEYDRLAPAYDERWAFYVRETTRETLKRLALRPGERLLDVGCGSGALLRTVAEAAPDAEAFGVDLSAQMLLVARRKAGGRAQTARARAGGLPFPGGTFDVLASCSAFHYFPSPGKALAEFRRVLKPGGRIVLTDWCNDYLFCRALDLFLRAFNRAHYRAWSRGELLRLLEGAGFEDSHVEAYKIGRLWGLMTAQARKGATR